MRKLQDTALLLCLAPLSLVFLLGLLAGLAVLSWRIGYKFAGCVMDWAVRL